MKPMCEANCGKRTQVYGCKYCPECYQKYSSLHTVLNWCPASEAPRYDPNVDEYLILNSCDGYHLVYANYDDNSKKFEGFSNWMRDIFYNDEFYVAWAKLPDQLKKLHPIFVDVK